MTVATSKTNPGNQPWFHNFQANSMAGCGGLFATVTGKNQTGAGKLPAPVCEKIPDRIVLATAPAIAQNHSQGAKAKNGHRGGLWH